MAESVLERFPWIDWCHRGDGEEAIVALARGVETGADGFEKHVPGLAHRVGDKVSLNPRTQIETLEGLPDPDYGHYFELRANHPALKSVTIPSYLPVEVSRGCLHRCTFCNFNAGVNYRPRPVKEVAAAMRRDEPPLPHQRLPGPRRLDDSALLARLGLFETVSPRRSGDRILLRGTCQPEPATASSH